MRHEPGNETVTRIFHVAAACGGSFVSTRDAGGSGL